MNKLGTYAALAAFSLITLSSCKETKNYIEDDRTPIRLSSSVELGGQRLQDLQIVQGQNLSFFVTTAGDADAVLYENREITANGTGGFGILDPMYYPSSGENVDFYAIHPYTADATLSENIDFSVAANQSNRESFLNSDLLHATNLDVTRTVSAVPLTFTHKMVKLDFIIKQGDGADISGIQAVTTLAALPSISISPLSGALSGASGTRTEIISYGVAAPAEGAQQVSGISAIIVPQTFTAGERLFRIRLGGIDYFYTPSQNTIFLSGNNYTLELTINQAGIELVSTINPWTNGGTIEGEGSIE